MLKYLEKIFGQGVLAILIIALGAANWFWPFYRWFGGDTPVYRFIWLGIFFVLLDILIEIWLGAFKEFNLMTEAVGFSRDLKKMGGSFKVLSKVTLPDGLIADDMVVGSSGVWLIDVQDGGGVISFNGDDIVQGANILRGLITKTLERSYIIAEFLKTNLGGKDFKVSPVLVFSSSKADLSSMPKMVRSVYVASRTNAIPLIENTDVQLIDQNTIGEIYEVLKDPAKVHKNHTK